MQLIRTVNKPMNIDFKKKFILLKCDEISFYKIRAIFDKLGKVTNSAHDPLNDEAHILAVVKDTTISVESLFSDYLIRFPESCKEEVFDVILNELERSRSTFIGTVMKWISKINCFRKQEE